MAAPTPRGSTARRPLSSKTSARLRHLYGGKRCVVSGSREGVDWHHLNENPRDSRPGNIVPLSRDHNLRLESYRRLVNDLPGLAVRDERLTPDALLIKSRQWFREGLPGLAYGASRVATWLVIRYRPLFPSPLPIASITQSLGSARHAAQLWAVYDVVDVDVRWAISSGELSPVERAQILVELAAAYEDMLEIESATTLLDAASNLVAKLNNESTHELNAKLLRRKALVSISDGVQLRQAAHWLDTALDHASESNIQLGIENARAWLTAARGRRADAAEMLDFVVSVSFGGDGLPRPHVVAPWNAIETVLTRASLEPSRVGKRSASKSEERLRALIGDPEFDQLVLRPVASELSGGAWLAPSSSTQRIAAQLRDDGRLDHRLDALLKETARALIADS